MSTPTRPFSLHELLAVETHLENQATKTRTELKSTFEKKRHLFEEKAVTFTPLAEGQKADTTIQSTIQTTIEEELKWIQPFMVKSLDASLQVAEANTQARADIVLESGETIAVGVPATALLELEKRVADLKGLVEAIPTLDPAKGFFPDSSHAKQAYRARDIRKPRTQKIKEVVVLHPATKEHPAQVQLLDKDVVIGTVEEQEWSALITPADKADLIDRVEVLSRAVRQARSRANNVTVDPTKRIGKSLLDYVFSGKV
jgi:hypothetical protein